MPALIVGLLVGATIGVFLMGWCAANGRSDLERENASLKDDLTDAILRGAGYYSTIMHLKKENEGLHSMLWNEVPRIKATVPSKPSPN